MFSFFSHPPQFELSTDMPTTSTYPVQEAAEGFVFQFSPTTQGDTARRFSTALMTSAQLRLVGAVSLQACADECDILPRECAGFYFREDGSSNLGCRLLTSTGTSVGVLEPDGTTSYSAIRVR